MVTATTEATVTADNLCITCERPMDLIDPLVQLDKDLKAAARTLKPSEVRYLVDYYYQMQINRIRAALQTAKNSEGGEPNDVLDWVKTNSKKLESNIRVVLNTYTDSTEVGLWLKSIVGIGPVIASGLLAHIDIAKAPTVGHIWRYAGLDPTIPQRQQKGVKSPYNIRLKTLCWKIGESFVKVQNQVIMTDGPLPGEHALIHGDGSDQHMVITARLANTLLGVLPKGYSIKVVDIPDRKTPQYRLHGSIQYYKSCPYAPIMEKRKLLEQAQNEAGNYADQAANKLATTDIGEDTDAYKAYSQGLLPPAHIHSRAKRYAVKIFLSHLHHVMFEIANGSPPPQAPYVIAHLGHVDYMPPPNWPMS